MSKTITLQYPVTVANKKITSVTVNRLTVKNLRTFNTSSDAFESMFNVLTEVTELMSAELNELDAADYENLTKAVESFLESGQETGKT